MRIFSLYAVKFVSIIEMFKDSSVFIAWDRFRPIQRLEHQSNTLSQNLSICTSCLNLKIYV